MNIFKATIMDEVEVNIQNRRHLANLFFFLTGAAGLTHLLLVMFKIITFLESSPIFVIEVVFLVAACLFRSQMKQWIAFKEREG